MAVAIYEIMGFSPGYPFPYWLQEKDLQQVKKMHSSDISVFYEAIGREQQRRKDFHEAWITHVKPIHGVYYDITSISSYSTKIDYIKWEYRDSESLPPLNMGLVCCQERILPFFYNIFPGSIVDVTTVCNFIKYLRAYNL